VKYSGADSFTLNEFVPKPEGKMRDSSKGSNPMLPVGSNRCQCSGCDRHFSSVASFDKHRIEGRCLTTDEMLARGMAVNDKGYWVTAMYDPSVHSKDAA
jgi:hypothetical protein